MRRIWHDYSLSITLFTLFVLSWAGQGFFQWKELANDAHEHGQAITTGEFIPSFLSATFENWQSEFLQLFSFVVLATYLIHRGSPQSRDGEDEVLARLDRIERALNSRAPAA